jgi:glycosyltransferase involved in cell wall biosynthesis
MNYPSINLKEKRMDNTRGGPKKVAIYLGNATEDRGLLILARASKHIKDDILIRYVGPIRDNFLEEKYKNLVKSGAVDLGKFELIDAVTYDKVPDLLNQATIGLIPFQPTRLNKLGIPMKMFEYMAFGLPTICSNFKNMKKYIVNNNCGIAVNNPEDPKEWASAINQLFENKDKISEMSKRGIELFKKKYNWKSEEKKLLNFCEEIINE